MAGIFEIVDYKKFKTRCLAILPSCPGVFLCGFLWEAMGFACNCSDESAGFYFATGFGSGMGAFLGQLYSKTTFANGWPSIPNQEVFHAVAYFCAAFFGSGTAWQRIVNDTILYGMNFTEAFFFVWLMCFLLFQTVLTVMRFVNTRYTKKRLNAALGVDDFLSVRRRFFFDIQLSLSIACADAFFVGTVTGVYKDTNWLAPAFGVYPSTHKSMAMVKSGASTLVGFLVLQLLENAIMKHCWVDPMEPEEKEPRPTISETGMNMTDITTKSPIQENSHGDRV